MSDLRELVIDAHGGIERWNKVKAIEADMAITGAMWVRKGWPDALKNVHVTADTKTQWISYRPFISEGMCSVCTPDRTLIETQDGKPIKDRKNPRTAAVTRCGITSMRLSSLRYPASKRKRSSPGMRTAKNAGG